MVVVSSAIRTSVERVNTFKPQSNTTTKAPKSQSETTTMTQYAVSILRLLVSEYRWSLVKMVCIAAFNWNSSLRFFRSRSSAAMVLKSSYVLLSCCLPVWISFFAVSCFCCCCSSVLLVFRAFEDVVSQCNEEVFCHFVGDLGVLSLNVKSLPRCSFFV